MIYVTQSWDDGVVDDVRLVELLRKHRVQATFNLVPGHYRAERYLSDWRYLGTKEVHILSRSELPELYRDFEIASHSTTHQHLEQITADKLAWELAESREQLENIFQRPVRGLAYPFGSFNAAVKEEARRQGFAYARTAIPGPEYDGGNHPHPVPAYRFPQADPMEFATTTHQRNPKFWDEFARAKAQGNYFHFWGHSYEFLDAAMWAEFEAKLARLCADPDVRWVTNLDLFTGHLPAS